jgi:MFS family permease
VRIESRADHKPGPLVWGPLSEVYGRTRPLFIGFAIFAVFQIPIAVAQNIETIMICRFLVVVWTRLSSYIRAPQKRSSLDTTTK